MSPYFALAGGDKAQGFRFYAWNSALSQALYTPRQGLEVAIRNGLGAKLHAAYGPQWYELNPGPPLNHPLTAMLQSARTELAKRGIVANHGRIIAELNWGFWTGILAKKYETDLWRRHYPQLMHENRTARRHKIIDR